MYQYRFGGMCVCSNVPFPQMVQVDKGGPIDLEIEVRFVGCRRWLEPEVEVVRPYVLELTKERVILEHSVHGRMTMTAAGVLVEVEDLTHWEQARTYVLGTGLAVCFYMKGCTSFHMSAVRIGDSAVAFAGESYAGKSTWAALTLIRTGGELLCDDVARIERVQDSDESKIWPALSRLRFREDLQPVLAKAGLVDVRRDPQGRLECYSFPMAKGSCALRAVFLPIPDDVSEVSLQRIDPAKALRSSFDNVFRVEYGTALIGMNKIMRAAFDIASSVRFYELRYRSGVAHAERNVNGFVEALTSLL